jgi:hypothetical protein
MRMSATVGGRGGGSVGDGDAEESREESDVDADGSVEYNICPFMTSSLNPNQRCSFI